MSKSKKLPAIEPAHVVRMAARLAWAALTGSACPGPRGFLLQLDYDEHGIVRHVEPTLDGGRSSARVAARKRFAEALVLEGFAEDASDGNPAALNSKAFDETPGVAPDLTRPFVGLNEHLDRHDIEKVSPMLWSMLGPAEQVYVAKHPELYRFKMGRAGWPEQAKDLTFGTWPDTMGGVDVFVLDDAFDKAREAAIFAAEVRQYTTRSLAWGLAHENLLAAGDADCIRVSGGVEMFNSTGCFHHNPARWGIESEQQIAMHRTEIAKLQRRLGVLVGVEEAVQAAGGWDAFVERYKVAVREQREQAKAKSEPETK